VLVGVPIHREKALDAQLLECDVLRRAERRDGREGGGHFAVFTKSDDSLEELVARVLPLVKRR
jgi:hypothetical protein